MYRGADGLPAYFNVTCCHESSCNAPLPASTQGRSAERATGYAAGSNASTAPLTCWRNLGRTAVVPYLNDADLYVCIKYEAQCSQEDSTSDHYCTAEEIANGQYKWRYGGATEADCSCLKTTAGYRSVYCCNTTQCNRPDPAVDSARELLERIINPSRATTPGRAGQNGSICVPLERHE